MVEYDTEERDKGRIAVEGGDAGSIGVSWESDEYVIDDMFTDSFGTDSTLITISIKEGYGGDQVGNIGVVVYSDRTHLIHMSVPESHRGSGVGSFLFDVFVGICLWNGEETITGKIGGGEGTKAFFIKNGVPEEDIFISPGSTGEAAEFDTGLFDVMADPGRYVINRGSGVI